MVGRVAAVGSEGRPFLRHPHRWPADTVAVAALIVTGLALRLWQYLADTSLWYDELSIARNIHERSLGDLMLRPLGYDQIAPLGFLAPEKVGTLLWSESEPVLRFFPVLCGMVALVLFWRVAKRSWSGMAVPIAVGLFALGIPLIRYTAEVKQYATDIVATLGLTLLALDLRARSPTGRRCVWSGLAGFVAILFSQSATLVMAGLGAALVTTWLTERTADGRRPAAITVPIWALASLTGVMVSRRYTTPDTLAWMQIFWRRQGAFLPHSADIGRDASWAWGRAVQFFGDRWMLRYPWPMLYAALVIVGFVVMWRGRRGTALILLGPLVVTFVAAAAGQYPFVGRVVLFLLPGVLMALAVAIDAVRVRATRVHPLLGMAALVVLVAPPVYATLALPPPYVVESFKPVLSYVQAHRRAGDLVYVHPNAYEALAYYGPRFGLAPGDYVVGICDPRDLRPYFEDVDRFRGAARLWVIGSSVAPYHKAREAIGQYLQAIGVRRDSFAVASRLLPDPVSADLFDLSDSSRLRSTTASTFHAGSLPDTLRPACRDRLRPPAVRVP